MPRKLASSCVAKKETGTRSPNPDRSIILIPCDALDRPNPCKGIDEIVVAVGRGNGQIVDG
jgi:hypothetical protein